MKREVVLTCTDRGCHPAAVVLAFDLPAGIGEGEYVRWTPLFDAECLYLRCPATGCRRTFELRGRNGRHNRLLGELERLSRVAQRVTFDLSAGGF